MPDLARHLHVEPRGANSSAPRPVGGAPAARRCARRIHKRPQMVIRCDRRHIRDDSNDGGGRAAVSEIFAFKSSLNQAEDLCQ